MQAGTEKQMCPAQLQLSPGQAQQEVLENTATGRLQASGLPPSNATHSTTRSKLGLRLFLTEA